MDRSLSSNVTDDKYMDISSNGDSYGTEPTVFNSNVNSNTDSNTNSNANCNADSGINCNANSITGSDNTYKIPA